MLRALLLLTLAAGSRQLSMTEFLVPAALEAGEDAELHCKYDLLENESDRALFVKWWWTPLNNTNDERYPLYQRIAGHPAELSHRRNNNIEILQNDGLKLLNVTPKVSGTYECEVSNIDEVRQHKKLIVFSAGSGPLLNVSVSEVSEEEPPMVVATCEAFEVAPRPDIVITLNGKTLNSSGDVIELEGSLYYDVNEYATVPLEEAEDGEFKCEIFFEDDDVPHAPYTVSQMFTAPTASTPEPDDSATEPAPAAPPADNGSNVSGGSWMLLTSFFFLIIMLHLQGAK